MSMPSQKPGMAMNNTDNARATPSGRLFGLNALRIPTGRPTSQETIRASTPISALIGPRCAISAATVSPRSNDLPRRPAPMSPSQRTYCTGSGSLSPRSAMMRARSAGFIDAWPSTPRMATSGSPGRTRRMTKMLSDTPSSVTAAYTARRARYFLTGSSGNRGVPRLRRGAPSVGGCGGPSRGPPPQLGQPDVVPAHDVVDAEVRGRVLSVHAVVPGVVDLLVGDGNERRILLEDVLGLADQRLALTVVQLALDLIGDVVKRRVRPARVVLGAVLAVPRAEDVGRVHQRRHNSADRQVEVAGLRFIEPYRRLYDSQIALDVQVF